MHSEDSLENSNNNKRANCSEASKTTPTTTEMKLKFMYDAMKKETRGKDPAKTVNTNDVIDANSVPSVNSIIDMTILSAG